MMAREDTPVSIATQAIVQILRAMYAPTALVHVGWGNGLGDLTQWTAWQLPQTFVIEAEESKATACRAQALSLAQAKGQPNSEWQTIHATLSAQTHEQPYHLASNPSESGLVPPESLQSAWPHLQTVGVQKVMTRSLDEVWQDISLQLPQAESTPHTWLIIDCLPAADILSGGVSALQAAHVVCARSLLAKRASLCDQMRTAGWVEAAWAESQHPAFGHAWFTRDSALELDKATQQHAHLLSERDALARAKEAETAAKAQALAERDALAQTCASETQAKELVLKERDTLAQAKVALQSQLEALEKTIVQSQAQLGINSQTQTDLQGQLASITQAQSGLQSELESAAKQQAQLTAERDALAKAKEAETAAKNKAISERDALTKEKQTIEAKHKESQERSQQLESTHQDLQNRQRLQHEELVKAEAQIELIKDLLLREQGI